MRSISGVYIIHLLLRAFAAFAFAIGGLFLWMFYVFYLKWVDLFENGRYFDPVSEMVYHEGAFVYAPLAGVCLLAGSAAVLAIRSLKHPNDPKRGIADGKSH